MSCAVMTLTPKGSVAAGSAKRDAVTTTSFKLITGALCARAGPTINTANADAHKATGARRHINKGKDFIKKKTIKKALTVVPDSA
ncbi:hypothetical protein GALL_505440 [mine drainage metagenome]|uniref:Uncharacterized protein n=1 Tax=mine drainage metagenome TaxID=410659 RepID=A0A1J5P9J5_9ZZZZ